MIRASVVIAFAVFTSLGVLKPSWIMRTPQENPQTRFVEFDGLKPSYASCARVNFSIRNVFKGDVYVEAFVENFRSGSWADDTFPYAINDPASLYRKTVRADAIKPAALLNLSYNRCLKPRFVKEDDKTFKRKIAETDVKVAGGTLQRIRVEVRITGQENPVQKTWSEPFKRSADQKLAGSAGDNP